MGNLILDIPDGGMAPESIAGAELSMQYRDASLSSSLNFADHMVGDETSDLTAEVNVTVDQGTSNNATSIPSAVSDDDVIFVAEERGDLLVEHDQASSQDEDQPDPPSTLSPWTCGTCGCKCSCQDTFDIHKEFCKATKWYPCHFPGCTAKFQSRSLSVKHFRSVHNDQKIVCNTDGCTKSFKTIQSRKQHIKREHLKVYKFHMSCSHHSSFVNKFHISNSLIYIGGQL